VDWIHFAENETLKSDAVGSSETLVTSNCTTRRQFKKAVGVQVQKCFLEVLYDFFQNFVPTCCVSFDVTFRNPALFKFKNVLSSL
jgi:hypothetical protein